MEVNKCLFLLSNQYCELTLPILFHMILTAHAFFLFCPIFRNIILPLNGRNSEKPDGIKINYGWKSNVWRNIGIVASLIYIQLIMNQIKNMYFQ